MPCQKCQSDRVADVSGKCSDMCSFSLGEINQHGYAPHDVGIGGGDYVEFEYCLDCGQMQGTWPLPKSKIETGDEEE